MISQREQFWGQFWQVIMDDSAERPHDSTIEGNILVAGSGFIVTAGAWALFGFLKGDFSFTSGAGLFFALAIAHGVVGVLVLRQRAISVPLGVATSAIGLAVAGVDTQFVLVFTNVVILALLFFARKSIRA
jgi:hypothetical protein